MRAIRRRGLAMFVSALLCAATAQPAIVAAQVGTSVTAAKNLFDQGVTALASQRWSEAENLFRRSVELVPRSSSLYNLALSLFELQRYRECVEICDRILATEEDGASARYRDPAQHLRDNALASVAVYVLAVDPADASVRVDGVPTGGGAQQRFTLEPGAHRIAASAPGHVAQEIAIDLKPGEQTSGSLVLIPLAETASPAMTSSPDSRVRQRAQVAATSAPRAAQGSTTLAWVVLGAGAAVLVGALVTGLLANASDDEFTEKCGGIKECDPSLKPLQQRTERLALASDIMLGTGAAAVGTGITLFLLSDSPSGAGESRPQLAVRGVGARVRGSW